METREGNILIPSRVSFSSSSTERGMSAGESVSAKKGAKPTAEEALALLKAGNERFAQGKCVYPHLDAARLKQAGTESQADHAYATVLACSDSRVPVERVFDAGIMDVFVVRVAGNVCAADEIGSIEYGLAHVTTPVVVLLGHTQCGAVTAVTRACEGERRLLERNIAPLAASIEPAVRRVMAEHPDTHGDDLIGYGIEENVWQGIENLFMQSPVSRESVRAGKVKVVGAVYDVGTGVVRWLPELKTFDILRKVQANPGRATNTMAQ